MDNDSNSKFQFRLSNELAEDFKLACIKLGVKPSEKLRDLMTLFLEKYENEFLNKEPYVFPNIVKKPKVNEFTIV